MVHCLWPEWHFPPTQKCLNLSPTFYTLLRYAKMLPKTLLNFTERDFIFKLNKLEANPLYTINFLAATQYDILNPIQIIA
jgi:hypothetical protein